MKPKDRVAFVIATGLVTWGIVAIAGLTWRNKSFTEGGAEILMGIVTGLAASLAAYFATKNNNHK